MVDRPASKDPLATRAFRRARLSRVGRWLVGADLGAPEYRRTQRLFVTLFGAIFAIAFASFWVQLDGLIGSSGIAPAAGLLERAHANLGNAAYWRMPTLLWLGADDGTLHALCALGVVLSLAAAVGFAPRWCFLAAWVAYLSLVSVGDVFLGYQWDALLLEAALVAALFAPAALRPRWHEGPRPSRVGLWLLRWLLFRVMFLSGVVKLSSGDAHWADLTALEYHYWSQPLPHAVSHWVHHLPSEFHRISTLLMFAVELGVPFLYFAPGRLRAFGGLATLGLMLVIAGTGNYGFFEPLIGVLCITLFDDHALGKLVPKRWRRKPVAPPPFDVRFEGLRRAVAGTFAVLALTLTTASALRRTGAVKNVPGPVAAALYEVAPLHSFNSYGLFAVMTTERDEIRVEGSRDGVSWELYEFPWKPDAPDRAPGFCGPHMPRLDWQLWFASLRGWQRAPWFLGFSQRLLEGSPAVLGLIQKNPFPGEPPKFLRATVAPYRFSSVEDRRRGVWWTRGEAAPYGPVLELVDGELRPAWGGPR